MTTDELRALFPKRSSDAIKSHAFGIGLGARFIPWSEAEDSILREIWSGHGSLKSHLHRLPGRNWRGALHRARLIGLGSRSPKQFVSDYSWVEAEIMKVLSQAVPLTAREIAASCSASYVRVTQILSRHAESKWHAVDWRHTSASGTGNWSAVWAIGAGANAPRPPLKTKSETSRDYRAKKAIAKGRINPFAALIQPIGEIKGQPGRVFIHLTDSPEEMEVA
jgi:hypothetical protein